MPLGSLEESQGEPFSADVLLNDDFSGMLWSVGADQTPPESLVMDNDSMARHSEDGTLDVGPPTLPQDRASDAGLGRFGTRRMAAVNVLQRWFDQHSNGPYPTKEDKFALADQSGLTVTQVMTWFANTRRRRKYKSNCHNQLLNPLSPRGPIDISRPLDGKLSLMSPLERWRNSPPEAEAASFDAIMGAVIHSKNTSHQTCNFRPFQRPTPNDARSIGASNASASALSNNSVSSASSLGSHSSNGSFGQFYTAEPPQRRRRRRKRAVVFPEKSSKVASKPRPYQCTFCTDTFSTKYDWTRHEKTLHLSLESYVCSPNGPIYTDSAETERCVFCGHPHPSDYHVQLHSYSRCQEKPEVLRTFYRKDHLLQHLRLVHGVNQFLPVMTGWKSQVDSIKSRCGLCGENFVSWTARNEHLAKHFREGALMKDWRASRGLDPSVALAVENAMPPYLIGIESVAPDPFSASRQVDSNLDPADNSVTDPLRAANPSPFEYFTVHLTNFVREAQNSKEPITDAVLQTAARHIVYGEGDPWNQTPADNAEWLDLFKMGMGLDAVGNMEDPLAPWQPYGRDDSDLFPLFLSGPSALWDIGSLNSSTANIPGAMEPYTPWSCQSPDALTSFRHCYTENTAAVGDSFHGKLWRTRRYQSSTSRLPGPNIFPALLRRLA
ncbi:hypothetical protein BDW59DRAFT_168523 [Aspergillus cavernicola]|uniref:Homeobox and C2H2 transcription factor n=1 Tax=Aspergillus cavernicola TaxID=176166 RepID=A0ABR4J8B7_9EURO